MPKIQACNSYEIELLPKNAVLARNTSEDHQYAGPSHPQRSTFSNLTKADSSILEVRYLLRAFLAFFDSHPIFEVATAH